MSLRALTATISFQDKATSSLTAVDSGISGIKSNLQETQVGIDNLSNSTSTFSTSASRDISEVGGEVGDLSNEMGNLEETTEKSSSLITQHWNKIAIAIGAASVALEAFSRLQQGFIVSSERVAYTTGLTAQEVRDLAVEVQGVTFSMSEVYDVLQTGSRIGLKTADELKSFAGFWDTVSSATGESATALAEASVALRGVGIEAGREEEALAAFGFVQVQTTGTVEEFLTFLQRTGPELRAMGMDVNDAAAIMGVLERELGMTARIARTEFRKAVNEADGELGILLDTLGIGEDTFYAYKDKVDESSGAMQHLNDVVYDSMTPLQHLKSSLESIAHQYGANVTPALEILSPILAATSSAMMFLAAAQYINLIPALKATAISIKATSIAFLTSPLGWVVIAITAIVAVLAILILNFDKVREVGERAWNGIKNAIGGVVEWISKINLLEIGKNIITSLIDGIKSGLQALADTVKNIGDTIVGGIKGFFGIASPSTLMMEFGVNMGEGLHIGLADETKDFFGNTHEVTALMEPVANIGKDLTATIEPVIEMGELDSVVIIENPYEEIEYVYPPITPQDDMTVSNFTTSSSISIGDINVYSNAENPVEVAEEVERTLRRAFGDHADRYFAKVSRSM